MTSKVQLRRIHLLLRETTLQTQKTALVLRFSNGREESSRLLLPSEVDALIQYLEGLLKMRNKEVNHQEASCNQMRRKIISICYNMKWETPDGKADMVRLEEWCLNKSYLKKSLHKYSYMELPKLVSQLQVVYHRFITSMNNG